MSSSLGVVLAESEPEIGVDKDHEKNASFQHPWIGSSSQIRLLNVEKADPVSSKIECTLEIVDVSRLPVRDYATLSYCWGEARADRDIHEIYVDKQPFWIRTNLWNFFQSMHDLEVHLPIYIDAICLNQLDNAERSEQVKLMSSVYRNANHTHVWLGSPHPDQELYLQTLRGQLSNDFLLSPWQAESFIGLSFLFSRNYWQRLWIVQELLLSNSITLHCGNSTFAWDELLPLAKLPLANTFFDAPEDATWWDAWHFARPQAFSLSREIEDRLCHGWQTALRLFHHRSEWLARTQIVSHAEGLQFRSQGFPFYQALPAFQSQQCGDRKDKVYALLGLLDEEGRQMISPNYQSSLEEVFVEAAATLILSYWRVDVGSTDFRGLKYESRTHCDTLNRILRLSRDDLEVRVSKAVRIATSYNSSLPNPLSSAALQSAEQLSNGLSYPIQEEVPIETQRSEFDVEPAAAETPLQQAIKMIKHEFTNAKTQELANTKLKELNVTIAAIQNKQRATSTLQNMTRLRAFVNAVNEYGELLDRCAEASNTVCLIWGSMRFLLQTTIKRSEAFDSLLSRYEQLGESLPSCVHVKALSSEHQSEIVGVVFRNVFEFHSLALQYFRKPAWQQLFPSSGDQLRIKLEGFILDISKHKKLVSTQANGHELEEARQGRQDNRDRFSELLEHARQERMRTEESFKKLDADEVARRRLLLFHWLHTPETMSDHEHRQTVLEKNPTSGQWLLRNAKFRAWYDSSSVSAPMLWVTGQPGAGKSVLASLVIEEARKLQNTTTLFFYCKHDDPDKKLFLGMARSILHQLLLHDDTLLMYLYDVATRRGETSLRTIKLAKEVLRTCLSAVGKTYVIIDGIDECEPSEQQHIANFWTTYVENSGSDPDPSRCALFGQEDASTRPLFCRLPTVRVQGAHHDNDIRSYCVAAAEGLLKDFDLAPYEKAEIAGETARLAQGMFLFARLVMHNLSQQVTKAEVLHEIHPDVFPRELNDAYDRIIARILMQAPEPYHKHAKRLLAWTTCSARVLKWREIQAAVSIDLTLQMVNFDSHQLSKDSKTLCGALVEELPNGDVSFVHSTVRPYLIKKGYVEPELEHAALAQLCLDYLTLPAFSSTWPEDDVRNALLTGTYAFMEYAISSWTTHIEKLLDILSDTVFPNSLTETLHTFFRLHWKEPRKRSKPTKRITELTNRIDDMPIYDKVKDSMSSMHCLMSTNQSDLDAVQTSDVFAILARVRSMMEGMALQPDFIDELERFYGDQLYKCPRVYCKWFHEGFSTGDKRQSHVEKHERSHYCSSLGCVYATFGFPTAKDLAKHVTDVHVSGPTDEDFPAIIEESDVPEEDDDATETSQPAEKSSAPERTEQRTTERSANVEPTEQQRKDSNQPTRRRRKGPSTYECDQCPKRFTRAFGLQSHMKTHADVLEFECKVCGKKFARQRDCKRHEEAHSGERKFVCHGTLKKGGTWGCLRRFARADALGRHFRSEAGRNCIRPLLDEEKETQNDVGRPQEPSIDFMVNGSNDATNTLPVLMDTDVFFPATLQQQYPDLEEFSYPYPGPSNNPDANRGLSPYPDYGEPSSSAGSMAYQGQSMDSAGYEPWSSSGVGQSTEHQTSNYLDDFEGR